MSGYVIQEQATLSLLEICEICGVSQSRITPYIREGLVDVEGDDEALWRFSETTLVSFQKAYRLEQDLRLNPAGVVLVLELKAQITALKTRLKRIEE